jgi:hypothetical protein
VIYNLALFLAWVAGSVGSGAALAWLYKRLHPSLAFYKLWAVWTMVMSLLAAIVLLVA